MTERLPSEIMFGRLNLLAKMRGLPEKENWVGPRHLIPQALAYPEDFFSDHFNDLEVNVRRFAGGFARRYYSAKDIVITRSLSEFKAKHLWVCNEVNNIYRANIFTDEFFFLVVLAGAWNNGNCRKRPASEITNKAYYEALEEMSGKNGMEPEIMNIDQAMGLAVSELRKLTENPETKDIMAVLKLKTSMKKNRHLFGKAEPKYSE